MVKPSKKRIAIKYLKDRYQAGIKRIVNLLGLSRSAYYYESKKDDTEVIEKLKELMQKKPNRGIHYDYRRSRREDYRWSRDKILRVYREQGMVRRSKKHW